MARTKYGKYFTTKRGRYGRYKYVNGKRVGFVGSRRKSQRFKPTGSRGTWKNNVWRKNRR